MEYSIVAHSRLSVQAGNRAPYALAKIPFHPLPASLHDDAIRVAPHAAMHARLGVGFLDEDVVGGSHAAAHHLTQDNPVAA